MSQALRICIVILVLAGASFALKVSISAPANGAIVGSSFTVQAAAGGGAAITGWRVYIDGKIVSTGGATSVLSAPVSVAAGAHSLVVSAWDATGAVQSAGVNIDSTTPEAISTAGPIAPPNSGRFANLERQTAWSKCSSPACSGGAGTAYSYYVAPNQTTPSLSGSSAMFYIDGAPYTNDLFGLQLTVNPTFSHFIYDFWVYPDGNTATQTQALEYDLVQIANNLKYVWGTQCDYATRTWDTWNEVTQVWIHSNAVCQPLAPNAWHHIKWAIERVGAQTHYLSVTVDGVTQTINNAYAYEPAPATNWINGSLIAQVQQDINASHGAFREWMDQITVYAW